MDTNHIKKLAEDFTSQTYGTEIPDWLCFSTCFPLSILLNIFNIKHDIRSGKSPKNGQIVDHIWLTLDNEGTILDPTIRQFDESMDSVYLGKLTENTVTRKYIPDNTKFIDWFESSYHSWTAPLVNEQYRTQRPVGFEERTNLFNVKAACILYGHIEEAMLLEEFLKAKKCQHYFLPIFKFLRHKFEADSRFIASLKKSMPGNFESFLERALAGNGERWENYIKQENENSSI